jgi:hypothetical protein
MVKVMMEVLTIAYFVLCAAATAVLVRVVIRSKQRLEKGIEDFREELERNGPINPYLALAELYMRENQDGKR